MVQSKLQKLLAWIPNVKRNQGNSDEGTGKLMCARFEHFDI